MSLICPGRCNAPYRRAEAALLAEPHGIAPVPGEPVWCLRCTWLVRRRLLELDDLAAQLQAAIDGHRGALGERVGGSRNPPSPDAKVDLFDRLLGDLTDWENELREALDLLPRPSSNRGGIALTRAVAWLGMHAERLLAHREDGERFGRAVLEWHHRLEEVTRTRPDRVRKPGRCPRCHTACLVLRDADRPADRRVECESCNRILTMDEYDQLAEAERSHWTGGAA